MSEVTPQATPAGWYPDGSGATRWWDGQQWGPHAPTTQQAQQPAQQQQPVYVNSYTQPKRVNHVLHLILSILTLGLWVPVWIIIAMAKS